MKLPDPVRNKRCRLYTAFEVAQVIGCSERTIYRLEKEPLSVDTAILQRYLSALGWRLGVYPVNREL